MSQLVYTFAAVFVKSLLFMSTLQVPNASGFNLSKIYFGEAPICSHLMFILFFVAIGLFFKNGGRRIYWTLFNAFISVLLVCDIVYYRAYGAFLSLRFISHPIGFNPQDLNLWSYIRPIDMIFLLDFVVMGLLLFRRKHESGIQISLRRRPITASILMAIAVLVVSYDHYRIDVKDTTNGTMLFFYMCWAPFQSMSDMSPIGYHLYDGIRLFGENRQVPLMEAERKEVSDWFDQNAERLPDNHYKGMFSGKNLIVIQVESLEDFVLGERVNDQEITPNLNRLLGSSLRFSNFYEQVNNGTSSDSDLLTTTSVYPLRSSPNFFRYPTNTYNSLPKLMEGIGYHTISSHPEPAGNWNWVEAHHSIGYQESWDVKQFNVDERIGIGISDESYMRQLSEKIKDEKQPFMLHFVTLTSHGPFDMPKEKRELRLDSSLDQTIMGDYFQAVHYTDKQIGAFLDKLDQAGLLDNSVVAIYGDHTGVHKYYQDKVNAIPSLENEAWRTHTLKIPFLVYGKGTKAETIQTIGGQIDTLPTLAYLMGVDAAKFESTAMGRILVNTKRDYTLLNDGSVIGTPSSATDQTRLLQSFRVADLVHESNYFDKP